MPPPWFFVKSQRKIGLDCQHCPAAERREIKALPTRRVRGSASNPIIHPSPKQPVSCGPSWAAFKPA